MGTESLMFIDTKTGKKSFLTEQAVTQDQALIESVHAALDRTSMSDALLVEYVEGHAAQSLDSFVYHSTHGVLPLFYKEWVIVSPG